MNTSDLLKELNQKVRCAEAERLLGTFEWQLENNSEYGRVDEFYDRIVVTKNNGHVFAELVQGKKHIILYDVDDTGRNEGIFDCDNNKDEGRTFFSFL